MTSTRLRYSLFTLIVLVTIVVVGGMIYLRRVTFQHAEEKFAAILQDQSPSQETKQEALRLVQQHPLIAHLSGSMAWAAQYGDDQMCRVFLDAGGDPNAPSGDRDVPPILYACNRRDPEMVKLLIHHGAYVDQVLKFGPNDNTDSTLLHMAVFYGNLEICELLIHAGADVNAADALGETPLFVAVTKGNPAIVQLLLHSGARCQPNHAGTTLDDLLDSPPEGSATASEEAKQEIRQLLDEYCSSTSETSTSEESSK